MFKFLKKSFSDFTKKIKEDKPKEKTKPEEPKEEPKVEGMEDLINLDTEALRVYYGNWNVDSFIARYQKRTRVSWLTDGRYIRTKVQPEKGILFYPPTIQLKVC